MLWLGKKNAFIIEVANFSLIPVDMYCIALKAVPYKMYWIKYWSIPACIKDFSNVWIGTRKIINYSYKKCIKHVI